MRWPSPQDYREAIQNPRFCLSDPELQDAELELDALQLPLVKSGQYATVFTLRSGSRSWAVRCFLHNFLDRKERYQRISDFILRDDLEYTVGFELIEKGIKVDSQWFPILKMDHVEGQSLGRFLADNVNDTDKLKLLLKRFNEMTEALKGDGIAHGDLQHDNVMVTADMRLRLIDYDGMYVPALSGWNSNELGHRNYQHPARNAKHFGAYLDNFSHHVIAGSLNCLIEEPGLWQLNRGDESVLLMREDFLNPDQSEAFFKLEKAGSGPMQTSHILRTLLSMRPEEIPGSLDSIAVRKNLPVIVPSDRPAGVLSGATSFSAYGSELAESIASEASGNKAMAKRTTPRLLAGASRAVPPVLTNFPSQYLFTASSKDSVHYNALVIAELKKICCQQRK